jgi:hypothetical protein
MHLFVKQRRDIWEMQGVDHFKVLYSICVCVCVVRSDSYTQITNVIKSKSRNKNYLPIRDGHRSIENTIICI